MQNKRNPTLSPVYVALLALMLLVWTGFTIDTLFDRVSGIRSPSSLSQTEKALGLKAFEKIDKALQTKKTIVVYKTSDRKQSPFKLYKTVQQQNNAEQKEILKLSLKGILNKSNPLAIIQDDQDKTYICKELDRIDVFIVQSISTNKVILRNVDTKKCDTLMVKDQ